MEEEYFIFGRDEEDAGDFVNLGIKWCWEERLPCTRTWFGYFLCGLGFSGHVIFL